MKELLTTSVGGTAGQREPDRTPQTVKKLFTWLRRIPSNQSDNSRRKLVVAAPPPTAFSDKTSVCTHIRCVSSRPSQTETSKVGRCLARDWSRCAVNRRVSWTSGFPTKSTFTWTVTWVLEIVGSGQQSPGHGEGKAFAQPKGHSLVRNQLIRHQRTAVVWGLERESRHHQRRAIPRSPGRVLDPAPAAMRR